MTERKKKVANTHANSFRSRIEDEDCFVSTCEGGDPGAPGRRSVWLLGIEPGWSLSDDKADHEEDVERDRRLAAYAVELQLEWPFNRNAFKLLSALEGDAPEDYRDFALRVRPFERGSDGYFKANLFPEPCNNVGEWDAGSVSKTGFPTKDEYRTWLRKSRFRVMKAWIERCRPRLVIGTGLTHLSDFFAITGTREIPPAHTFTVNGHPKRMYVATSGLVPVVVVPHLTGGAHSLNSNAAIGLAAAQIRPGGCQWLCAQDQYRGFPKRRISESMAAGWRALRKRCPGPTSRG